MLHQRSGDQPNAIPPSGLRPQVGVHDGHESVVGAIPGSGGTESALDGWIGRNRPEEVSTNGFWAAPVSVAVGLPLSMSPAAKIRPSAAPAAARALNPQSSKTLPHVLRRSSIINPIHWVLSVRRLGLQARLPAAPPAKARPHPIGIGHSSDRLGTIGSCVVRSA